MDTYFLIQIVKSAFRSSLQPELACSGRAWSRQWESHVSGAAVCGGQRRTCFRCQVWCASCLSSACGYISVCWCSNRPKKSVRTLHLTPKTYAPLPTTAGRSTYATFTLPTPSTLHANSGCRLERKADFMIW